MKRFLTALVCGMMVFGGGVSAKEKPLRNSIEKKVKLENLSFRGKYRFGHVKQPTRRGAKAQRFEIRHGDCGKTSGWNDCTTDRQRVEMKERPKNSMSKPGKGVWYGYSILIPSDFVSLGKANTTLGQVKAEGWSTPMWWLTFNDRPYIKFADGRTCSLGALGSWKGRWVDLVVFAHYFHSGQPVYFQLFKDDKLLCQLKTPFMPAEFARKTPKLGLK